MFHEVLSFILRLFLVCNIHFILIQITTFTCCRDSNTNPVLKHYRRIHTCKNLKYLASQYRNYDGGYGCIFHQQDQALVPIIYGQDTCTSALI